MTYRLQPYVTPGAKENGIEIRSAFLNSPALVLGVGPLGRLNLSRVAYVVFITSAVLALFVAAVAVPRWTREDGVYESATALGFALAALAAACLCLKAWASLDATQRWVYCLAGGVSLLAFLSEVSFGARKFGWAMPAMQGGGELDGAHDLFILLVRWVDRASALAVATAAVVATLSGVVFVYVLRGPLARLARRMIEDPVFFRLLVSVALLVGAVGLDAYSTRTAELLEESLETVASMGVLYAMTLGLFSRPGALR